MMAANVLERVPAMLLHVGFTVIVFYGVVRQKKLCLPAAILLHMLADSLPALFQRGAAPLWAVELWLALCAAGVLAIAGKLYGRLKDPAQNG